jgi:hypothetical protein
LFGSGAHDKNLVRTYKKDDRGNLAAEYVNTGADHFAHSLCYADIGLSLAATTTGGEDIGKVT